MPLYLSKLTFPKLYAFKADFRPADHNNFSTLDIKVLEIHFFIGFLYLALAIWNP